MTALEKLEALQSSGIGFEIVNGRLFGFGAYFNDSKMNKKKCVSADTMELCIERLWEGCKIEFPDAKCFNKEEIQ